MAALFVRNLAIIQAAPTVRNQFWSDLEKFKGSEIFLPVDSVIECIFAKLNSKNCLANTTLSNFININSFLKKDMQYTNK